MPDEVKEAVQSTGVSQTEHDELTDEIVRATVRSTTLHSTRIRTLSWAMGGRKLEPMRRGFERMLVLA